MGLGTTATSLIFLGGILAVVAYMTISHDGLERAARVTEPAPEPAE